MNAALVAAWGGFITGVVGVTGSVAVAIIHALRTPNASEVADAVNGNGKNGNGTSASQPG